MASNFLACRAGMMPSQSWVTNSQVTFICVAECLGDIDVEAGQRAVCFQIVEGRVGPFRADDDLVFSQRRTGNERESRERGSGEKAGSQCHGSPLCNGAGLDVMFRRSPDAAERLLSACVPIFLWQGGKNQYE